MIHVNQVQDYGRWQRNLTDALTATDGQWLGTGTQLTQTLVGRAEQRFSYR